MPSAGLTVVWFLGVIALIPITLWLLKRSGLATGGVAGAQALIKPVNQLNIGPGQRLVTVEVGSGDERTWLVLGVTAQQITALHTLTPQSLPDAPAAVPSFTAVLRRSLGQQDKGAA
jgi:flagellar protein FliO/FliZ